MTKHETPVAEPSLKVANGPTEVSSTSALTSPGVMSYARYRQQMFEGMWLRWPDPMLNPPDAGRAPVSLPAQLGRLLNDLGPATRRDSLIAACFNDIVRAGCGNPTCLKCEKLVNEAVVRMIGELIRDRDRLQADNVAMASNQYRYVSQEFDAKAAKNPLPMKPDPVLKEVADANGGFIPVSTGMVYWMSRREDEEPKTLSSQSLRDQLATYSGTLPAMHAVESVYSYVPGEIVWDSKGRGWIVHERRTNPEMITFKPLDVIDTDKTVAIAIRERSAQTQANIDKMKEQMKKGSLPEPETGVYTPRPPCKLRHGPFTNGLCDKCGQPEYPSW